MRWGGEGPLFADRAEAGARLADRLRARTWSDPVVLGLVRGGVPIALHVATALDAPLDVAVSRKIGAPSHPEFGVGAVTAEGHVRYDDATLAALGLTPEDLRPVCLRERAEAQRRLNRYRAGREAVPVGGRDVLLIDDGLATGVTARAALDQLRVAAPRKLVFAAPVCAEQSSSALCDFGDADDVVCLATPPRFGAVGWWYEDFRQTTDDEVLAALSERDRARH
jgi:putative phosphoribosyl transferase